MIFGLLCSKDKGLSVVILLDEAAPLFRDDVTGHGMLILREKWNLDQH